MKKESQLLTDNDYPLLKNKLTELEAIAKTLLTQIQELKKMVPVPARREMNIPPHLKRGGRE